MDRGHDLKATLEDPCCKELHLKSGQGHMKRKTTVQNKIGKVKLVMKTRRHLQTKRNKNTHRHAHTNLPLMLRSDEVSPYIHMECCPWGLLNVLNITKIEWKEQSCDNFNLFPQ